MLHRLAVLMRTVSSRPGMSTVQPDAEWSPTSIVSIVDTVIGGFDTTLVAHLLQQSGEDGVRRGGNGQFGARPLADGGCGRIGSRLYGQMVHDDVSRAHLRDPAVYDGDATP